MIEMQRKTCEWHDSYTGACGNGDSEHCADFTSDDDTCDNWEENKWKNG